MRNSLMFKVFELIASNNSCCVSNSRVSAKALLPIPMFLLMTSMSVSAACKNNNCACQPSELQFASPVAELNEDGQYPIILEADDVAAQGEDVVTLTGNAEVSQGRQTIVADRLEYYRETERVVANGNIELISENGDYLSGQSIDVVTSTSIGTLTDAQFKLAKSLTSEDGVDTVQIDSRGSAEAVHLEGEGLVRLENTTYTNCAEGNNSVVVAASELELDRLAGVGTARNATVRFFGVPIFYTPYLSFPINDARKTGFLTPGFGSDEDSGNIIEFPWYWNIAKNQDATITPRLYTDRGFQLGAEYRLRTQNSSTFVYGEVLPDDDLFGDDREFITFQHTQQFTDSLSGSINYNNVSDADYFDDLSSDVSLFSATYVPRDAQLNYSNRYFNLSARLNEFQVIDPDIDLSSEPLERLPSITFNTRFARLDSGLKFGLSASYINYNSDSDTRVDGARLALTPYLEQSFESSWGYIKPAVSLNYRAFDLENIAVSAEDKPSYVVPALSVDSGLYFEKDVNWFGRNAVQTLEPRLFYAYAPDEDQDDVPLFDSSDVDFNNYNNIFRVNRFFGQDRFADTNQATLGLTTRIIDQDTGVERVTLSVGQVYYLDDLEQTSVSGQAVEQGAGDFLAELTTRNNGAWTTYSFIQYDHDADELRTARFDLAYQPLSDDRKRLSVGYFFSDLDDGVSSVDDVDQLTFGISWPVADRWQFSANERYSIEDSESLYRDVGIEYNGCCWKLRLRAQDRISNRTIDDKRTSVFLELELTSLGRIRTGL